MFFVTLGVFKIATHWCALGSPAGSSSPNSPDIILRIGNRRVPEPFASTKKRIQSRRGRFMLPGKAEPPLSAMTVEGGGFEVRRALIAAHRRRESAIRADSRSTGARPGPRNRLRPPRSGPRHGQPQGEQPGRGTASTTRNRRRPRGRSGSTADRHHARHIHPA